MVRYKLNIPNLTSTIQYVEEEYAYTLEWLNQSVYKDFDEDEYLLKDRYYKLLHIILYKLEVWERNLFIGSHFASLKGDELGRMFNITRQSVYNYMTKINKKIKQLMNEYD